MDGFIRVVHKHSSVSHQLWQIYFPEKLLLEFEKGSCRIIPHHELNDELQSFKKDHKRLAYAPEEHLDLLLDPECRNVPEAQEVVDRLFNQFSQLLVMYEGKL